MQSGLPITDETALAARSRSRRTAPRRPAPKESGPQRRCIASGEVGATAPMLRFVADPDGHLICDLAEKLPGRGAWVLARRDCVEKAVKRRLFARALGGPVEAQADLANTVEAALERRFLELLGLCSRAGLVVSGYEKVRSALSAGKAAALLQAADASPDGRGKLLRLAQGVTPGLPVAAVSEAVALGRALGREQAVHLALRPGRLTDSVLREVARLQGMARQVVSRNARLKGVPGGTPGEVAGPSGAHLERDQSRGMLDVRYDDDE